MPVFLRKDGVFHMESKSKISVIIPVYNVEDYVDACIESVVHQTYENLEIILVDDGSKDQSGRKCDLWAEKDSRIRVIHKENSGPADTRNAGMLAATGDYLGFVDADDVAFPDMYSELFRILQEENAQISCCNEMKGHSFDLKQERNVSRPSVRVFDTKEAMESLVLEKGITVTVWNKLYCRSVVEGILFEKGRYIDDEFWMYRVIAGAEKIVSLDSRLYGYRQRENSLMTQHYSLKHLDLLDARACRLRFLEKYYPELVPEARCNLRFECIRACQLSMLNLSGEELKIAKRKAADMAGKYPLTYADYKKLSMGRQFWCVLSRISFSGVCHIRNWFHFGP